MALASVRVLQATMLDQLLEEINFQRTKEMRQLLKDECGFVVLQGTTYWTDLFVRHFLFPEPAAAADCDDLLFFVRKRHLKGSSRHLPKYETEVEVFRKDSKRLPIGDPDIDWEETVYLNLIVHQFDYTLTLAVCTRTSPKELQILRRHSQKVYASPSRRKMDTKGEGEEMTYPHICFMVDNFDEVFSDMVVRDGEMVCVELVARGRPAPAAAPAPASAPAPAPATAVIFLGSVRYDALSTLYDSRQSSLSTKVAQRMSLGLLGGRGGGAGGGAGASARCEFVRMRGPHGKGHAEMCVSKARGCGSGVETPMSEPGHCAADLWDSDWEDDPDDFFLYTHQRRLSDPSANMNNLGRWAWRKGGGGGDAREQSRSESEGLDCVGAGAGAGAGLAGSASGAGSTLSLGAGAGLAEVEAGDPKDERRRSVAPARSERGGGGGREGGARVAWCCAAPGARRAAPDMAEVYARAPGAGAATSAACLRTVSPRRPRPASVTRAPALRSFALAPPGRRGRPPPARASASASDECEYAEDATNLDSGAPPSLSPAPSPAPSAHSPKQKKSPSKKIQEKLRKMVRGAPLGDVRGEEELPCCREYGAAGALWAGGGEGAGGRWAGARAFCTLPRRRGGVARALYRGRAPPPRRTTPDGTDVYYWCDAPAPARGPAHELDDGAYNPVWGLRGFSQSFQLWKEGRRQQCSPLLASLTYVTLPWFSIAKDILDHREQPILTF